MELIATGAGEADAGARARVEAHAAACGSCRADLGRYRTIEQALTGLRTMEPPARSVASARERLEGRLLDLRGRLIGCRIFRSPFGDLLIGRSEQGVALVEYLDSAGPSALSRLARAAGLELVEDGEEIAALYRDLLDYIEGRTHRLAWPLDLRLARSDFHRAVLRATAAIPYGAVVSYKRLAREIERPEAVRAVAQALRWNPLPIVIPCHRVVGTSGALVGYAGGATGRKQRLLSVEGVPLTPLADDFRVRRELMYVLMPGDAEYCLPSCPSTEAVRRNAPMLFASRARAEAVGFAPCTTCRPDLHPLGVN
jgi:O-6-methylguanine DNA methyltransferase